MLAVVLAVVIVVAGAFVLLQDHDVTVTKEGSGSVTPEMGSVGFGGSLEITMQPASGWHVEEVTLNGETVTFSGNTYTYEPGLFASDDRIHVVFAEDTYETFTVSVDSGEGGTTDPSGEISVRDGGQLMITIMPDAGHEVGTVMVDGVAREATNGTILVTVTADVTVEVTFKQKSADGSSTVIPRYPVELEVGLIDPTSTVFTDDDPSSLVRVTAFYNHGPAEDVTDRSTIVPGGFDGAGTYYVTASFSGLTAESTPFEVVEPVGDDDIVTGLQTHGKTVVLNRDGTSVSETFTIPSGVSSTLDLAGKRVDFAGITVLGTLTIVDSEGTGWITGAGEHIIHASSGSPATTGSSSAVIIDGGFFDNTSDGQILRSDDGCTITINGGVFADIPSETAYTLGSTAIGYEKDGALTVFQIKDIDSADRLAAFAEDVDDGRDFTRMKVELSGDVDLTGVDWTPIGCTTPFRGTFDGNGFTISGLSVKHSDCPAGLFGILNGTVTDLILGSPEVNGSASVGAVAGMMFNTGLIDKVTVRDGKITGNHYVGGVVGFAYGSVVDCTVTGGSVSAEPDGSEGNYDNGDDVGGLIGYLGEGRYTVTGNNVNGTVLLAYRDAGGVVGSACSINTGEEIDNNNTLTGNTSVVEITIDQFTGYYGGRDPNAGSVVGRVLGGSIGSDNSGKADVIYKVGNDDSLELILTLDTTDIYVVLCDSVAYDVTPDQVNAMGGKSTKTITIVGGEDVTLTFNQKNSDWNHITTNGAKLILRDLNLTNSGHNDGPWNRHDLNFECDVEFEHVTSDKAMAFKADATLRNVTIDDANTSDTYAIWIQPNGQTVTIDGCTIDMMDCSDGRGLKIDEQYVDVPEKVTLVVSDTVFKTEEKSAILVKSMAGADITLKNVDISMVAEDDVNEVWVDEASSSYADLVTVTGGTVINEPELVSTSEELKGALETAGAAGSGDTTISITSDIVVTGDWEPIEVDGYHGADIVTVEGNHKKISGLTGALFAGGFAGGSGIVIKNLTIANSEMEADNTLGYGAFVNCADSMDEITLINCHLVNSTIITPNDGAAESKIGGLVGWTSGYNNQNDGPVDSYITLRGCTVVGCTIKGAGSVGGLIGHAGANPATFTVVEDCEVKDNTLISTDDGGWRVGVAVGTANAGHVTISGITESGNTLSQTGKTAPEGQSNLYGRFVPSGTGTLTIYGEGNSTEISSETKTALDLVEEPIGKVTGATITFEPESSLNGTQVTAEFVTEVIDDSIIAVFEDTAEILGGMSVTIGDGASLTEVATLRMVFSGSYGNLVVYHEGEPLVKADTPKDDGEYSVTVDDGETVVVITANEFSSYYVANPYIAEVGVDKYVSIQDAVDSASPGEKVVLLDDVAVYEPITIDSSSDVIIDLKGFTISGYIHNTIGHVIVNMGTAKVMNGNIISLEANGGSAIRNDGSMTVEDCILEGAPRSGTGWPSYVINNYGNMWISDSEATGIHGVFSSSSDGTMVLNDVEAILKGFGGSSHVFYVSGDVTVNGGSYTHMGNVDGSLGYIMSGGSITIDDGTFTASNGGYGIAAYGGSVEINGGSFANDILDWGGSITIRGGTFAKDPSKFVAEGYESSKASGKYHVLEKGWCAVSTGDELVSVLSAGKNVLFMNDISMEAEITAPYGNKMAVEHDGGIIDGGGYTLSVECYGDDYGIMTSGGTIKNLNMDAGCRAIVIMSATEDVILDNVYISGDILYPINTGEHPDVGGVDLVVTDSTFGGWSSFAGIESASFSNCKFIEGDYGYDWPYESLVKPYVDTSFEGCSFAEEYYLDLSALGQECVIVMNGCDVEDVVITAENCLELFGEIELPSDGRALSDCIKFP